MDRPKRLLKKLYSRYEFTKSIQPIDIEAIEAGTRNAADSMGKLDEFGTIAAGKRADMILVEANPLDDVANIMV